MQPCLGSPSHRRRPPLPYLGIDYVVGRILTCSARACIVLRMSSAAPCCVNLEEPAAKRMKGLLGLAADQQQPQQPQPQQPQQQCCGTWDPLSQPQLQPQQQTLRSTGDGLVTAGTALWVGSAAELELRQQRGDLLLARRLVVLVAGGAEWVLKPGRQEASWLAKPLPTRTAKSAATVPSLAS